MIPASRPFRRRVHLIIAFVSFALPSLHGQSMKPAVRSASWFRGWYTRITSSDGREAIGIITAGLRAEGDPVDTIQGATWQSFDNVKRETLKSTNISAIKRW